MREVWIAGRKLLASLQQQMRDPCRVVGIDRPGHANEPAHIARVTYPHDFYGFESGRHDGSLLAEPNSGSAETQSGLDPLTGAPTPVPDKELADLGIRVLPPPKA